MGLARGQKLTLKKTGFGPTLESLSKNRTLAPCRLTASAAGR